MRTLINKLLGRQRWSELAIDIYERQDALARAQKIARITLGDRWAAGKSKATPHRRIIEVEFWGSDYAQVNVVFGPPPIIKESSIHTQR